MVIVVYQPVPTTGRSIDKHGDGAMICLLGLPGEAQSGHNDRFNWGKQLFGGYYQLHSVTIIWETSTWGLRFQGAFKLCSNSHRCGQQFIFCFLGIERQPEALGSGHMDQDVLTDEKRLFLAAGDLDHFLVHQRPIMNQWDDAYLTLTIQVVLAIEMSWDQWEELLWSSPHQGRKSVGNSL